MSAIPATPTSRAGLLALSCAEAMWLAILLALPLAMNVSVQRSFEATKLMAVLPLAALALMALAAAALERAMPSARAFLRDVPTLAFIALIVIGLVSTAASETPWVAFFGDYFRREGMLSWLLYAVLFAGLLLTLRSREQAERLIDVILLSTVAPCVYAIMQRVGFDFFNTAGLLVGTSEARPGGTMGNPTFLASVLLLVIPLTLARALCVPPGWRARALWFALLAMQLVAALLTQSRGPLLGIAAMLFAMFLLLGARAHARRAMLAAFAAVLALAALLALINVVGPLSRATAGTPLQRFVYSSGDANISSRVGIWGAGVNAFTHAPLLRQVIGYGPDAASFSYYNWMPAPVQREQGYTETIDRLHNDSLETLLSFGVLGLLAQVVLFSSLVWAAVQRLLPEPGGTRASLTLYTSGLVLCTLGGALIAYAAGSAPGILPVAAAIGLAIGWVLFIAWRAWRHVRAGGLPDADTGPTARLEVLLIAAMISGLIGSWIETQVGVPTIATRALVAAYAALLILCARSAWTPAAAAPAGALEPEPTLPARERKGKAKRAAAKSLKPSARAAASADSPAISPWYPVLGWAAAFALLIQVADFFPPLSGQRMLAPAMSRLGLIIWPIVLTLVAAALIARYESRRTGGNALQTLTRFLLWTVPGPLVYVLIYAKIGSDIENAADAELLDRIASLTEFSYGAYAVAAVLLALALYVGRRRAAAPQRTGAPGLVLLAVGLIASFYAYMAMRADYRADVGAKLAGWSQSQGRPDASAAFLAQSMVLMPQERRYAGSFAARLIESASRRLQMAATQPEAANAVLAQLGKAEGVLARTHDEYPRDPWITFALANVHQFDALKLFAYVVPASERARHAEESRKYLTLANQQFPGHPYILRNWAQLELDQGNSQVALAKLEQMEKLDPANISAYVEWVKAARTEHRPDLATTALRRGLAAFPKESANAGYLYQELVNQANENSRPGAAVSAALEYTAAQPQNLHAWRMLAEAYDANQQKDLALATAESTLAKFPAPANKNTLDDLRTLRVMIIRLSPPRPGAAGGGTTVVTPLQGPASMPGLLPAPKPKATPGSTPPR